MCGIVGLVAYRGSIAQASDAVAAMNQRIAHRGPDGEGLVAHEDAVLAMKRLAIVDVVHGQQPMLNEDESIALVYNGEIYNAPELRRRLESEGVRFRTRSDTEVILRLYERNPDDVENQLVGMWAFAVHDRKRRRIVLSRDRFGIKPLFIADTGTSLAFASELRCFDRSFEGFAPLFTLDLAAAHGMVSWGFTPETSTIFSGVQRLAPATRLTIDLESGTRRHLEYWHLTPSEDAIRTRSLDEACEVTQALLRRAVKQHLESDVPVATFLSGGIDSSLVTAYANEAAPGTIKAYSIGFAEKQFDESPFARETAERLGVPVSIAQFDEGTARARLVETLLAYDEPFGDSSSLATYLLSSHVARDFKVALGGDGGDEVFAGYGKYRVVHLRRPFASVPRLRGVVSRIAGRGASRPGPLRRLSRGLGGSDAEVYARLSAIVPLDVTAPLMSGPTHAHRYVETIAARFRRAKGNELQRTLACDLGGTLTDDMLVKVDRASMACHLEARVPFLDHRVAEYGVGLPADYTLGRPGLRWSGKQVLRTLHQRRFGERLANRKKVGFGVPIERWLRGPFARACERLFAASSLDRFGLLAPSELSGGRHERWLHVEPRLVWHAFALAAWCEANLGEGPEALRAKIDE
jgi:asparagine synthase (glutamine-hydrolysing)